ncbi:MAG: DUF5946 family protein [Chloroflexota bacterium]
MSHDFEVCPGCLVRLPKPEYGGDTHPYIGASASCWTLFANIWGGGEPPIAPFNTYPLILDAYCVQHHGTPSPQAIQSVAIHALTLYGVLSQGVDPSQTIWIRSRLLRDMQIPKHERFEWLTPPAFEQCTIIQTSFGSQSQKHDPKKPKHISKKYGRFGKSATAIP